MKQNTKPNIRISSDFGRSFERLNYLRQTVIDGDDAKAVLKYANKFLEEVERETLSSLLRNNQNHEEIVMLYKVTVRFCEMLRFAAHQGERKQKTFEDLTKS